MNLLQRRALFMPYRPGKWVWASICPTYTYGETGIGAGTQTLKQWRLTRMLRIPFKCPRDPNASKGVYPVTACFYVIGRGFTWRFS